MMTRSPRQVALAAGAALALAGCGDGDPTGPALEVTLGETSVVVLVNPAVNSATGVALPTPGSLRSDVSVSWDGGPAVRTDGAGVAVLGPIAAGARSLSLSGGGLSGSVTASIAERDLHEIAVALTGSGAAVMADVRYEFGGEVIEVTTATPLAQVNELLSRSDVIVLFRGGTYRGDLVFSGSNVTLFGAGIRGGEVVIEGNVTVEGSRNRIRGARVVGDLTVSGSNAGVALSRVTGRFSLSGSGGVLLENALCGQVSVTGSNPLLLGNAGLAPLPSPQGGC